MAKEQRKDADSQILAGEASGNTSDAQIITTADVEFPAPRSGRPAIQDYRVKIQRDIYADEKRMKDVLTYELPPELDARAAQYEDDDPAFVMHIKRAVKYHAHKHCQGMDPWKIEVRARDDMTDRYNRILFSKRAQIPTPEEIRDAGIVGFVRLMLSYYDPFKSTKGGGIGGWAVISSKPIEILAPLAQVQTPGAAQARGFAQPYQGVGSGPAQSFNLDSFKALTDGINAMMMQTIQVQMEAYASRKQFVEEGITLGKLQQQIEEQRRQNAELARELKMSRAKADAFALQAVSQVAEEDEPESPFPAWLQPIIEQYGPAIAEKFGIKLPGAVAEEGPARPDQAAS